MAKNVIQLPAASAPQPKTESQSRVTIQIGSQRYAVNVSCKASPIPPADAQPAKRGAGCLVETRFLRLRKPVGLRDRIDGWRVCWIGGWDKGKVFFVVMVERTVPREEKRVGPSAT